MQKRVTWIFSESSRVYGMLVNLKKRGVASLIHFYGVNAKVSVALLAAFSNDLQILQKQTNYD